MEQTKMYQVSTIHALSMGYSKTVIDVSELLAHGNTGLGTFKNMDGEMIVADGHCYRADEKGNVTEADGSMGVPFSSVAFLEKSGGISIGEMKDIEALKTYLTAEIEGAFGLNSMHIVRIDGRFRSLSARSERPCRTDHTSLSDLMDVIQNEFRFEDISGTLVCIYYPDYMDGLNAAGWHLHFVSEDRLKGGHVMGLEMLDGTVYITKINSIEVRLPDEPAFDTYSLKNASADEIKKIEQGSK